MNNIKFFNMEIKNPVYQFISLYYEHFKQVFTFQFIVINNFGNCIKRTMGRLNRWVESHSVKHFVLK